MYNNSEFIKKEKTMKLRDYQNDLITQIKAQIRQGYKSICAVAPCGSGKSIIQANISKTATQKGNRVLFLVHRKELCEQIEETFVKSGVDLSLCRIAMVQTVTRNLDKEAEPNIIITDENHHCLAKTYTNIYDRFPNAINLGFTATPMRMNEGGLGKVYDSLVVGVTTTWLLNNHYLSSYKLFSVKLADASGLKIKRGDYGTDDISLLMEQQHIYGETMSNYLRIAKGKKTIIYCASIKASKETVLEFKRMGIKAEHLDGESPKQLRNEIVNKFKNSEISILSNVDLFGEGFDVPDCECVILLRPTKSLTLYIQQSMRCMRYKEGKEAIIIDHVGNVFEHGFPDDDREWSLEEKKKSKKVDAPVKQCPQCFFCVHSKIIECPSCGYIWTIKEIKSKSTLDIELQELTRLDILKTKKYSYYQKIKTFEEMALFQKAKEYKFAWCIHKCVELEIEIPKKYEYMKKIIKQNTPKTGEELLNTPDELLDRGREV